MGRFYLVAPGSTAAASASYRSQRQLQQQGVYIVPPSPAIQQQLHNIIIIHDYSIARRLDVRERALGQDGLGDLRNARSGERKKERKRKS